MKRVSFIAFIFLMIVLSANAQREELSLDGAWKFKVDKESVGLTENWETSMPVDAREVMVPHTFNMIPELEEYAGKAWYQRSFDVPENWKRKQVRIEFEAVYHDAIVFVNGTKVAEHMGSGYTTFTVDATKEVKAGKSNQLVVLVDNSYSEKMLPYKTSFDWANDGGIIRSVKLIATGSPSIRYAHINSTINFPDTTGRLQFKVKLWEAQIKLAQFVVEAKDWKTGEVLFVKEIEAKREGLEFEFKIPTGKVKMWDIFKPNLYNVSVKIKKGKQITDSHNARIGFREIKIKGSTLLLNRKAVRLPGIEYMPSSHPDYGSAEPEWVMDSVVSLFNDLNIKITRFHWQVDKYLLDKLDENGILVQAEIPWWQSPSILSPELIGTAKMQIGEMIERDYNHPSIFAWGVCNEVWSERPSQVTVLKEYAEGLDTSRFINVVSNNIFEDKENDLSLRGDIPTWNEYIGTWHGEQSEDLPKHFDVVEGVLKGRPLLITEHGLCEPRFIGGDKKRITEMIYHYTQWAKQPYIIGCIYFSLNDYRTQMGEDGAGKYKARIHGLTNMYFDKKTSYSVYKKLTRPIEILNVKKINDTTVEIELFNRDDLPSYRIEGFKISYMDVKGTEKQMDIPIMEAGTKLTFTLKNVAERFQFNVISPHGTVVNGYPIDN
ncbi:MAG: glycoside hydrolase family 2 TIM barrel-domain containing protein [Flavobacteriaceae bacterium]